jgi:transcriptional regulator with GAF, ATPase, and Fis domain
MDSPVRGIVGESALLQAVLRRVRTAATTDANVLIYGETGTGKERIARALHDFSARARAPFVAVNCAALPASLLESELFGHERGAFTGATSRRSGRFELAEDGSVFLDEVGELALPLQPKLLRVLQEREFERLGGSRALHANARVIAATNRDLRAMTRAGAFREDLYYRLNVVPIRIPPLRERKEDIPLLARHFADSAAKRLEKAIDPLSSQVVDRLVRHGWPGNVRELENVIERAVIFAAGPAVELPEDWDADTIPASVIPDHGRPATDPEVSQLRGTSSLAAVSRAHILRILEETHWVIAGPNGAAAKLEMSRSTLNARMRKLGIHRSTQL